MKIDCPHCGVHGSIEDSLARRKLQCPKCSKVFLLSDDVLPEADDDALVHHEVLYESEAQVSTVTDEQLLAETDAVQEAEAPEDDLLEILEEEASEQETADVPEEEDELFEAGDSGEESAETELCSECGESLHPDFLVTVGSKRYCALCLPEDEEAAQEVEEAGVAGIDEPGEADTEAAQALTGDEDEYLSEVCSVCGEKFHQDFLQEIDSKFYCGVCQPEVIEEITEEAGEKIDAEEIEEPTAESEALAAEALQKSRGAKGAIWALIITGLIVLAFFFFGR
jgi:formylmethanofuran dehydrogenase subunit E